MTQSFINLVGLVGALAFVAFVLAMIASLFKRLAAAAGAALFMCTIAFFAVGWVTSLVPVYQAWGPFPAFLVASCSGPFAYLIGMALGGWEIAIPIIIYVALAVISLLRSGAVGADA